MTGFLVLKDKIVNFYNEHGALVRPVIKFLVTFVAFTLINSHIGYLEILDNQLMLLVAAIVLSFVPWSLIVVVFSGMVIVNLYALTLEIAAVVLVLMIIMFLLFFRFSSRDGIFILLIPIAFYLRVPYVIPIVAGLMCSPASIVSVSFGTIVYYILNVVETNETAISNISSDKASTAGIGTVVSMITGNKEMILTVVVFAIVLLIVYAIRRKSIDHAWMKAILIGVTVEFVALLVGSLILNTNVSILWLVIGTALSLVIAVILQFFVFSVDYTRVEHTQFEDDEYYYYVKAVPKLNVAEPEMNVKRINAQRQHNKNKIKKKSNKN